MRNQEQLIYTDNSNNLIAMSTRMSSLVNDIIQRNIPVTVVQTNSNAVVLDLHAETYCGMYLTDEDGELVITGRYGFRKPVSTFEDVCNVFNEQFFCRSYGSSAWLALISEPELNR
jgi:hypothetical protein